MAVLLPKTLRKEAGIESDTGSRFPLRAKEWWSSLPCKIAPKKDSRHLSAQKSASQRTPEYKTTAEGETPADDLIKPGKEARLPWVPFSLIPMRSFTGLISAPISRRSFKIAGSISSKQEFYLRTCFFLKDVYFPLCSHYTDEVTARRSIALIALEVFDLVDLSGLLVFGCPSTQIDDYEDGLIRAAAEALRLMRSSPTTKAFRNSSIPSLTARSLYRKISD